jgi:endoglucanase
LRRHPPRAHDRRIAMPRLSAALAPLATAGPRIVNAETGARVRLVGVNRSGLEYAEPPATGGFLDGAGISAAEIAEIVRRWQARIVRLPFNQDFALRGRRGHSAEEYLAALDQAIAWAAAQGAYTLLDLQWLDADRVFGLNGDMSFNRVPPLPDAASITLWRTLAARYRDEPAVLFDLFNEPHSPLPDDPHDVLTLTDAPVGPPAREAARRPGATTTRHSRLSRRVGMREWQPWARLLIDTIRAQHPAALIFVAGVGWAYDLRGMPLRSAGPGAEPDAGPSAQTAGEPLLNIVYTTHVYPWSRTRAWSFEPWEREWDRAFGHLTTQVPVFAGEWGGGVEDVEWGARLVRYFDAHDMGWCAWSWADWPCLVTACHERDYSPTPFGALVRDALLAAS